MCCPLTAEAARKRVLDLEQENKRQRAALKARINEAAEAKRQLRELSSRVSMHTHLSSRWGFGWHSI